MMSFRLEYGKGKPPSSPRTAALSFCFHPCCDSSQGRRRRSSFQSCGSCSFFILPVQQVSQTIAWSVALKTSGNDDDADNQKDGDEPYNDCPDDPKGCTSSC